MTETSSSEKRIQEIQSETLSERARQDAMTIITKRAIDSLIKWCRTRNIDVPEQFKTWDQRPVETRRAAGGTQ